MIGAIVGDIIGSVYEWNNIKTKDFPLFSPKCTFTDDTVMTLAIAEGLMNGGSAAAFIQAMKKYGRQYPNAGYGGRFVIRLKFGTKVADIVAGCTDSWTDPKPAWRERKEQYLAHLNAGVSSSVLLVSCADKLHNARSILSDYRMIGERLWKRFKGGKDGVLWYYRALIDAYQHLNANSNIVGELNRVVTELETLSGQCEGRE